MTRWFNAPLELHRRWRETKKTNRLQRCIQGKYKLLHEIGQGASGIVHLAIDIKTNQRYAIKELNKLRIERDYYSMLRQSGPNRKKENKKRKLDELNEIKIQEIEILRTLPKHQNIIEFIKVIEDEDSIFIVTEVAEKGMVMDVLPNSIAKPYSNEQCRHLFKQLVQSIDHLHQHQIIHRDIKPQNLILSNHQTLKLIDFGNATKITDMSNYSFSSVGSPAFMAPELLKKVKGSIDSSPTCSDIWSMGVTLYCLAYGKLPFENSSLLDLYKDIQTKTVEHSDTVDVELIDLINKLLEKNPKDRITIKDIKLHSWMQK